MTISAVSSSLLSRAAAEAPPATPPTINIFLPIAFPSSVLSQADRAHRAISYALATADALLHIRCGSVKSVLVQCSGRTYIDRRTRMVLRTAVEIYCNICFFLFHYWSRFLSFIFCISRMGTVPFPVIILAYFFDHFCDSVTQAGIDKGTLPIVNST